MRDPARGGLNIHLVCICTLAGERMASSNTRLARGSSVETPVYQALLASKLAGERAQITELPGWKGLKGMRTECFLATPARPESRWMEPRCEFNGRDSEASYIFKALIRLYVSRAFVYSSVRTDAARVSKRKRGVGSEDLRVDTKNPPSVSGVLSFFCKFQIREESSYRQIMDCGDSPSEAVARCQRKRKTVLLGLSRMLTSLSYTAEYKTQNMTKVDFVRVKAPTDSEKHRLGRDRPISRSTAQPRKFKLRSRSVMPEVVEMGIIGLYREHRGQF
ncbi:hypothetical protein DFH09DRAFT_1415120 [Mycena vulgaris]|nr:hypothetical protein DFH09DRAFT_1415120 [Mycena vulgaris]